MDIKDLYVKSSIFRYSIQLYYLTVYLARAVFIRFYGGFTSIVVYIVVNKYGIFFNSRSQKVFFFWGGGRRFFWEGKGQPGILQQKSHLCIPFLGVTRPQYQFPHSCVCERFVYSQDRSTYFYCSKIGNSIVEYINRSQTHECGNGDCGRAIPFPGKFVSIFLYWFFAVQSLEYFWNTFTNIFFYLKRQYIPTFVLTINVPLFKKLRDIIFFCGTITF